MTETPFRAHGQSVADMEIDNLRARLTTAEARAEELAAIVESQRVMLAAADRYRALLDLETWMARAERAEADADRLAHWMSVVEYDEEGSEPGRLLDLHDAAVAERPQPLTDTAFHDHHVHKPIGWDGDRPLDCVIDGEPWPCSVTRRFQDIGSIEAVVVHKTAPAAAERPQP